MVGQQIANYRIVSELGSGGMGAVYRAEDVRLQRHVAVKFLRSESLGSDEHKRRFMHEARAAAALDHPHICSVYEIEEADGQLFMVMPLLEGESVDKRVARGPLPLTGAVDIAMQTAEALEEAHSKGIIHRDIKAGNIMVRDRSGKRVHATLMDFGLARLSQATKLTREGSALGTAAYMSPEQATGEDVDARTDIWSLGVLLYEMVIGRLPFRGDYEQALFYSILHETAEPMTSLRTGVPMELERIVNKCMAKSAEDRYPTAAGLLVDLRALRKELTGDSQGRTRMLTKVAARAEAAPVPASEPPAQSLPWYRRIMPLLWAIVIGSVLIPIAVVSIISDGRPSPIVSRSWDPAELRIRQLTREPGLAATPQFSPDGQLVVYAADQQADGDLDIWVQQAAGGSRVQLTDHPALDAYPSFSPDGSTVVFLSSRDGGGIYTLPALGGTPRLLVEQEGIAHYSPDGEWIAYATGRSGLFVVSADGGQPRKVVDQFYSVKCFVWLPEGDGFLLQGEKEGDDTDWWTVDLNGGNLESTGANERFAQLPLNPGCPSAIDSNNGQVLATAFSYGSSNLWRFDFDPASRKVGDDYERLTFGAAIEEYPTLSPDGRIAYFDASLEFDLWRVPLTAAGGQPKAITNTDSLEFRPRADADGRFVAFVSFDFAQPDVFVLDLATGERQALTEDSATTRAAILSPDAGTIAYDVRRDDDESVWTVSRTGGLARKVCDACGTPRAWTSDGRALILEQGTPRKLYRLTLGETEAEPLVLRDGFDIYAPDISPDGKWIAFAATRPGTITSSFLFTAPLSPSSPVDPEEWIPFATDRDGDTPRFSPNGRMVYFRGERDDYVCLWRAAIDPATGQRIGEPEAVQHFHSLTRSLGNVEQENFDMSVTRDSVIAPLNAVLGNIWIIEPVPEE